MGQLPKKYHIHKKYHISDDGDVYRVNDDGSFTALGNIEEGLSKTHNGLATEHNESSATATPPVKSTVNYNDRDHNEEFEKKPRHGRNTVKWIIAILILAAIGVAGYVYYYYVEIVPHRPIDDTVNCGACDSTVYIYNQAQVMTTDIDTVAAYYLQAETTAQSEVVSYNEQVQDQATDNYDSMNLATVCNSNDIWLNFPVWKRPPYLALNSSHINAICEFVRNNGSADRSGW